MRDLKTMRQSIQAIAEHLTAIKGNPEEVKLFFRNTDKFDPVELSQAVKQVARPYNSEMSTAVSDVTEPIGRKFTSKQSEDAIKSLFTSEERGYYADNTGDIMDVIRNPLVNRAYAVGSFASDKKIPSDFDLLLNINPKEKEAFNKYSIDFPPHGEDRIKYKNALKLWEDSQYLGDQNFDLITPDGSKENIKNLADVGVLKYGDKYSWKRLAGLLPLALGLMNQNEDHLQRG